MDHAGYELLDVEVADHIARVTFARPTRQNRYTLRTHAELARVVSDLSADTDVHVVLVTATGPVFSGGPDQGVLTTVGDDPAVLRRFLDESRAQVYGLVETDTPIVVALTGPALGAGLALALLADIIVVERHVAFSDGHVLAAMPAGDGGVLAWPASVGLVKAKRYLLTGDPITAEEAERLGLVTEVVDTGAAVARAECYARRLAAGPQRAIRYTKRALNEWLRAHLEAFDLSLAFEEVAFATGDVGEAMRVMCAEGRPALPADR